jgi:hypothetical protein
VDARDQDLFVIRSVKDADPATLRQITRGAPQEIVQQFGRAGMLETEHLASLRVNPGHYMPDCTVFSRRIHRLENQQDCVSVRCVVKLLLRA